MLVYEIGDRVVLLVDEPDDNKDLLSGHTGVVLRVAETPAGKRIGVKWDDFHSGHSLDGDCKYSEGWYVDEDVIAFEQGDDIHIDTFILDEVVGGGGECNTKSEAV